jgi:GNAT superfamily N-acetyltransferase
MMIFREARVEDIKQMRIVRNSVRENMLSDPGMITAEMYEEFLTRRGKGWVCEIDGIIKGFAVADLQENNIWALFVSPDFERRGIGKTLQDKMLEWYFAQGKSNVWLGTSPGTRAEKFYRSSGWKHNGSNGESEMKFEMSVQEWHVKNHSAHSYRDTAGDKRFKGS